MIRTSALLLGLPLLLLSTVPNEAKAATPDPISKVLQKGDTINVAGLRCTPTLQSITFSKAVLSCKKATNSARAQSSSSKVTLKSGQRLTVKSRGCFLTAGTPTPKGIKIVCETKAPTATPTSTATPTATATTTPSPTATVTPAATATSTPTLAQTQLPASTPTTTASATSTAVQTLTNTPTLTPTATPTATSTSTPTATATPTSTSTPTPNANVSLSSNKIISFNTNNVSGARTATSVTGLNSGEVLAAIDRRPVNGVLYGLGYDGTNGTVQLYMISSQSGVATPIGSTGTFVNGSGNPIRIGVDTSTTFSMDFDPTTDILRVISGSTDNFRINPNTGAFIDGDLGGGTVTGLNADAATDAYVRGAAYTNNHVDYSGAPVTTLYTLSVSPRLLNIQTPQNSGHQTSSISLSGTIDEIVGFDIGSGVNVSVANDPVSSGNASAVFKFSGSSEHVFSSINLTNGSISQVGAVPGTAGNVTSLTIQKPIGVPLEALANGGANLLQLNTATPDTAAIYSITGLAAGETMVGMDYRPATGELMGLGVNATANTATLYRIDPVSGGCTRIGGASGQIAFENGSFSAIDFPDPATTTYAVNFNPTNDRLRVITSSGLNFRVNPVTGAPVDGDLGGATTTGVNPDGTIQGATSRIDGLSYTNSYAQSGTLVTTLYTIDSASNALYISSAPNSGVQSNQLVITLSGTTLDFSDTLGFEIPPETRASTSGSAVASGFAYAILKVGGVQRLYRIDLTNGAATSLGDSPQLNLFGLVVAQSAID